MHLRIAQQGSPRRLHAGAVPAAPVVQATCREPLAPQAAACPVAHSAVDEAGCSQRDAGRAGATVAVPVACFDVQGSWQRRRHPDPHRESDEAPTLPCGPRRPNRSVALLCQRHRRPVCPSDASSAVRLGRAPDQDHAVGRCQSCRDELARSSGLDSAAHVGCHHARRLGDRGERRWIRGRRRVRPRPGDCASALRLGRAEGAVAERAVVGPCETGAGCLPPCEGRPRTRRTPAADATGVQGSGSDLLSQGNCPQVPSALTGLTSVFGMGTGVALPP